MKVKVMVSKDVVEDGFFISNKRIMRLSSIFEMEVINGCSAPLQIKQAIRLKPSCDSLHINDGSVIEYDVSSGMWHIWLHRWYTPSLDQMVSRWKNQYGFDTVEKVVAPQTNTKLLKS
jgi:hypothetical protein